jgi:hypothetical protein
LSELRDKVQAAREIKNYEQREEWERTRALAFSNAKVAGTLKNKNLKLDQFWPFPWDKNRVKKISSLPKEEQLQAYKERQAHAQEVWKQFMSQRKN